MTRIDRLPGEARLLQSHRLNIQRWCRASIKRALQHVVSDPLTHPVDPAHIRVKRSACMLKENSTVAQASSYVDGARGPWPALKLKVA